MYSILLKLFIFLWPNLVAVFFDLIAAENNDKEGGGEGEGLMSEVVLKGDQYCDSVVLNPYPITFRPSTSTEKKTRGPHTETDGKENLHWINDQKEYSSGSL